MLKVISLHRSKVHKFYEQFHWLRRITISSTGVCNLYGQRSPRFCSLVFTLAALPWHATASEPSSMNNPWFSHVLKMNPGFACRYAKQCEKLHAIQPPSRGRLSYPILSQIESKASVKSSLSCCYVSDKRWMHAKKTAWDFCCWFLESLFDFRRVLGIPPFVIDASLFRKNIMYIKFCLVAESPTSHGLTKLRLLKLSFGREPRKRTCPQAMCRHGVQGLHLKITTTLLIGLVLTQPQAPCTRATPHKLSWPKANTDQWPLCP